MGNDEGNSGPQADGSRRPAKASTAVWPAHESSFPFDPDNGGERLDPACFSSSPRECGEQSGILLDGALPTVACRPPPGSGTRRRPMPPHCRQPSILTAPWMEWVPIKPSPALWLPSLCRLRPPRVGVGILDGVGDILNVFGRARRGGDPDGRFMIAFQLFLFRRVLSFFSLVSRRSLMKPSISCRSALLRLGLWTSCGIPFRLRQCRGIACTVEAGMSC
jgi:hypothetical protein